MTWRRWAVVARQLHERGTLYIGLGVAGLATYGVLQIREAGLEQEARDRRALRLEVQGLRRVGVENRKTSDAVALFSAQVERRIEPSLFDGPWALTKVRVGDVVEVLEEGVGPEGAYHRCRNEHGEGLYPKACLARR